LNAFNKMSPRGREEREDIKNKKIVALMQAVQDFLATVAPSRFKVLASTGLGWPYVIMHNILLMFSLGFLLVTGCGQPAEKKPPAPPVAHAHPGTTDADHTPYYAGLIEEYRMNLAAEPGNLAALIGLGNAYLESGQWQRAITMYEHALRIDPQNADVRTDMGTAYRNQGKLERALSQYVLALKYDPQHLNARYNMGIVYAYEMHNYPAAIRRWEELLQLSPNYPQAEQIRAKIAALKKKLKKKET